jgi:hypothetical protein
MFGDQFVDTLVAAAAVTKGTVVVQSGTSGRNPMGGPATGGSSGTALVGIAVNEPANAGEHLSVAKFGRVRAVAGGAVAAGVRVTSNSVARITAAASGDIIVGYSVDAALANGDTFEVFVNTSQDKVAG